MSRGKGRYRTDGNAKPLIAFARACGWQYVPLDSVVDGLLVRGNRALIVDWKQPKGKLTERQEKLVAEGVPIHFIRSETDLRELLGVQP
jgi:hypothetical protein